MADITEFQLMKVSSFSDGTDTYKGVTQIGYRVNPVQTYGVRKEGELRPSRHEQVESDQHKVTGQITLNGPNADALIDTTIPAAAVTARDVTQPSGAKLIGFTNMTIQGVAGGANNRSVQGAVYDFIADDVTIADAP